MSMVNRMLINTSLSHAFFWMTEEVKGGKINFGTAQLSNAELEMAATGPPQRTEPYT